MRHLFCVVQSELELVQRHGVPSEDIVYSGVCKQVAQIKYAAKNGIDLLVCDNEAELRKISRCHPNAKYVPRKDDFSVKSEVDLWDCGTDRELYCCLNSGCCCRFPQTFPARMMR